MALLVSWLVLSTLVALSRSVPERMYARSSGDLKTVLSQPQNNWCSGTQVFYPEESDYANLTTQRWTTYDAPAYVASIKPSCVDDIATTVSRTLVRLSGVITDYIFGLGQTL